MKKFVLTILSALCVLFSICFIACDKNDNDPPKTYSYFGVVQTLDGYDGLYVNVPDFGVCQLPTYEEGKNPNLALKEGDLISMDFGSEIQVTKSYPAIISTPARYVSVYKKDIEFKTTNEKYLLTIDYTEEIENQFLSYDKKVGDFVYFWRSEGVPGKSNGLFPSGGGRVRMEDYATAMIEMLSETRLTLSLSLEQDMQGFFKYYAHSDLEIHGKSVIDQDGQNELLRNFFDLQADLTADDLEKVEIITKAGSVSPENREPTEYKTTTRAEDLESIYYDWLRFLNHANLKEISESEALVEGGNSKIMTVYTKLGNFKIYQSANRILRIWDRYFGILGECMPEIAGENTMYKFDYSMAERVGFYKWNQFARGYDFKISELSFKKTKRDYTLPRIGYFLKTDVGIIELYSEKIFYHEGTSCYYEVVGEENFSIIFDTQLPPTDKELENYERIIEIYTEKYCKDFICQNVVFEYYGEYESGAIVALVYCSGRGYATYEWTETVAGYDFKYGDANSINVFYNGDCYSLSQAYSNGYLTQEDIATISIKRTIFEYFSLIR